MARRLWFRRFAARISFGCLLGAAVIGGFLFVSLAYCLPLGRPCGVLSLRLTVPVLGAALILLFVGWATLSDLLLLTHGNRARVAHWLAGAPDPRHAISTFALAAALSAAGLAGAGGAAVNAGVGFVFGGSVLAVGISLPLLVSTLDLLGDRRVRSKPEVLALRAQRERVRLPRRREVLALPPPAPMLGPADETVAGVAGPKDT